MRRVVVSAHAADRMRGEMKRHRRTETGGVLVGRMDGDSLMVVDASDPGPRAKRRMLSVVIDGIYAQQFCDAARNKSANEIDYVGDWHCHLAWTCKPSPADQEAMRIMADFADSPTKTPISLIWAKYRNSFRTYLFTLDRTLQVVPHVILE